MIDPIDGTLHSQDKSKVCSPKPLLNTESGSPVNLLSNEAEKTKVVKLTFNDIREIVRIILAICTTRAQGGYMTYGIDFTIHLWFKHQRESALALRRFVAYLMTIVPHPFMIIAVIGEGPNIKPGDTDAGIPHTIAENLNDSLPGATSENVAEAKAILGNPKTQVLSGRDIEWARQTMSGRSSAADVTTFHVACDKALGNPAPLSCWKAACEFKELYIQTIVLDINDLPFFHHPYSSSLSLQSIF